VRTYVSARGVAGLIHSLIQPVITIDWKTVEVILLKNDFQPSPFNNLGVDLVEADFPGYSRFTSPVFLDIPYADAGAALIWNNAGWIAGVISSPQTLYGAALIDNTGTLLCVMKFNDPVIIANTLDEVILAEPIVQLAGQGQATDPLYNSGAGLDPLTILGPSNVMDWIDFADPATLFQDQALTIPAASNGDPVRGVFNKARPAFPYTNMNGPTRLDAWQNGRSAGNFDGLTSFLAGGGGVASIPFCYFIVHEQLNNAGFSPFATMVCRRGSPDGILAYNGAPGTYLYSGAILAVTGPPDFVKHSRSIIWRDSQHATVRTDNGLPVDLFSGAWTTSMYNGCVLGGDNLGGQLSPCRIGEFIVSLGVPTDEQIEAIKEYVFRKWNLL
jgi:hypothetical protein